ncbi:MAG: hypothetical protein WC356_00695 [Candidatus Micrarchaeia archaeon]|jgi:ribosomal protein S26
MGRKGRGKEKLETCCACGAKVPRNKAVDYAKHVKFSTDLRESDKDDDYVNPYQDSAMYTKKQTYCISCAKHRKIFEKKKKEAARRREEI